MYFLIDCFKEGIPLYNVKKDLAEYSEWSAKLKSEGYDFKPDLTGCISVYDPSETFKCTFYVQMFNDEIRPSKYRLTICDLMKSIYLLEIGNPPCNLEVESADIARKYGHVYDGKRCLFRGVNGRVGDIPAYLADCVVINFWRDGDVLQVRI